EGMFAIIQLVLCNLRHGLEDKLD
ncbi:MAG: hypothetical protein JWR79_1552, partial [Tardiphaga sp.]|nr:hypothetical protein [Tardiphaga sp.]